MSMVDAAGTGIGEPNALTHRKICFWHYKALISVFIMYEMSIMLKSVRGYVVPVVVVLLAVPVSSLADLGPAAEVGAGSVAKGGGHGVVSVDSGDGGLRALAGRGGEANGGEESVVSGTLTGSSDGSVPETLTRPGVLVDSAGGSPVYLMVSAGWSYSCGLRSDGSVVCWGRDNVGQASAPGGSFTQVSAGGEHSCGLRSDGSVVCWGRDNVGQASAPGGSFTQVSAGGGHEFGGHSCGLRSDGSMICWGHRGFGELGSPGAWYMQLSLYMQVSAGVTHSCGLLWNGSVVCWGNGADGQTSAPRDSFTEVSAGVTHSCGLRSDGSVVCWGANEDGQSDAPGGSFTQVSAGFWHSCGLRSDGSVVCWGANEDGQSDAPGGSFTQVSAGFWHSCGLRSDGSVVCWGANKDGQLDVPGSEDGGSPAVAQTTGLDDVPAGVYYSIPVTDLAEAEVFSGTGCEAGFCPDEAIDRKTMAVWLVRILDGLDPPPISQSSFHDVDPGSFHAPFIERLVDLGITTGCGDGSTFCPDAEVTRAQMAAFISRAWALPDGPTPTFTDVPSSVWYTAAVARLASSGITTGCGDGSTFCPDADTTRADMATFLHRAKYRGTTAGTENAETTEVVISEEDEVASTESILDDPQLSLWTRSYNRGSIPVLVFYCARQGKYTNEDLTEMVGLLNDHLSPRWMEESSQLFTMVFIEGSVVSPDLQWNSVTFEDARFYCAQEAKRVIDPTLSDRELPSEQSMVLIDAPAKSSFLGYAGRFSTATIRDVGIPVILRIVAHELGHSVLGLPHDFVWCRNVTEPLMRGHETSFGSCTEDVVLGSWNLEVPYGGDGLFLSCYHRRLLGWPVGGDSPPCLQQPPSQPRNISFSTDLREVSWSPPLFSDDVRIVGYTLTFDNRQRLAEESSTVTYEELDVPPSSSSYPLESEEFLVSIRANSEYGSGTEAEVGEVTTSLEVVITGGGPTSLALSWSPVPGATSYSVAYSTKPPYLDDPPFDWFSGTITSATTSLMLRNLEPETVYWITVSACGFSAYVYFNGCSVGKVVSVTTEAE